MNGNRDLIKKIKELKSLGHLPAFNFNTPLKTLRKETKDENCKEGENTKDQNANITSIFRNAKMFNSIVNKNNSYLKKIENSAKSTNDYDCMNLPSKKFNQNISREANDNYHMSEEVGNLRRDNTTAYFNLNKINNNVIYSNQTEDIQGRMEYQLKQIQEPSEPCSTAYYCQNDNIKTYRNVLRKDDKRNECKYSTSTYNSNLNNRVNKSYVIQPNSESTLIKKNYTFKIPLNKNNSNFDTISPIRELSFIEDMNQKYKKSMEDKSLCIINFNNNTNEILFCIFDGHNGDLVSTYLQQTFPKIYKKNLMQTNYDIVTSLRNSFTELNRELQKRRNFQTVGSTACVVHIIRTSDFIIKIYSANCGDTRSSLISPLEINRLSYDHRADDESEKKRIIRCGGTVSDDRVQGQLMVTRAFGDFDFKDCGVICEPYISVSEVDCSVVNQFLVLACDGIFDVIEEEDIQMMVSSCIDTGRLCKNIKGSAVSKGAWDNLSLFVVKLT